MVNVAQLEKTKIYSHLHDVKISGFSVTQILREINFEEFRSSKNAIFAMLGALNFVNLSDFSLQKVQKII